MFSKVFYHILGKQATEMLEVSEEKLYNEEESIKVAARAP